MMKSNPAVYNTASKINKDSYSLSSSCIIDIETESLDPKEGRIVCIGIKDVVTGKTTVFYHDDEEKMLKAFLDYYNNRGFAEMIEEYRKLKQEKEP